jgi:hypothetical protein
VEELDRLPPPARRHQLGQLGGEVGLAGGGRGRLDRRLEQRQPGDGQPAGGGVQGQQPTGGKGVHEGRPASLGETLAANEALAASGHLVLAEALEQVAAATTVRVRNRRLSATDGPFTETHEQLGGFVLIEARDLNEAIQIAGRLPGTRLGSVEVRPVIDLLRERSGS